MIARAVQGQGQTSLSRRALDACPHWIHRLPWTVQARGDVDGGRGVSSDYLALPAPLLQHAEARAGLETPGSDGSDQRIKALQ